MKGQTFNGVATMISMTGTRLVLPYCPDATMLDNRGRRVSAARRKAAAWCSAGQAVVEAAGVESGNIRGTHYVRPDTGATVRPDFVLIDDPQTEEVALSSAAVAKRAALIDGAVMGMAGPTTKVAAFMTATVIANDDLASLYLDREKRPHWAGTLTKMLPTMPTNDAIWEQYSLIRQRELAAGKVITKEANTFYRENRGALEEGATWSWPERVKQGDVAPLQTAMHIYLDTPIAFFSEYQNEPYQDRATGLLSVDGICDKQSGHSRYVVPSDVAKVFAFIDVQLDCFFYCVTGFTSDMAGTVIDYGTYPEQPTIRYTKRHLKRTLGSAYPRHSREARWLQGLRDLIDSLADKPWQRADGASVQIDAIGVDAGYGDSTPTIKALASEREYRGYLLPCFGRYIGATTKALCANQPRPGEDLAVREWQVRLMPPAPGEATRHCVFDSNHWKTLVHQAWATPAGSSGSLGAPGSLQLFDATPEVHRLYAEHQHAEQPHDVTDKGNRTKREWKIGPGRPDNDLFDCTVGTFVMAVLNGVHPRAVANRRQRRRRGRGDGRSLAEMRAAAAAGRKVIR
jgi:hypothetical protein